MEKCELKIGDVVQINEYAKDSMMTGAFLVVTEPKSFGAQGYIATSHKMELVRLDGLAYLRVNFEEIDYIGHTTLMPQKVTA